MIDLSVLVCTTNTRYRTFGLAIQDQLWPQFDGLSDDQRSRVEILILNDSKSLMLGQKRNVMVDMAQGRYVVFIDDDDRIEPDYLSTLLEATATDVDVITFLVSVSLNGGEPKTCRYSKNFRRDRNTQNEYERLPNHICCVKRELASAVSFPNILKGEDSLYAKLLLPSLQTEYCIDRVMYHYDYSDDTTETQPRRRSSIRVRKQAPIVDVVMLSNAKSASLRRMTQKAIDTCLAGANSLPVNVIVMEQQRWAYKHAITVRAQGKFNYNRLANHGARIGSAEWIMVANNDLVFHDGWLHHLLAADHPVVSPKCPRDRRQAYAEENTTGYETARHLSGWCFMLRRELWEKIGGLDESTPFWAADDVTIEQLRAIDITPMLVVDSLVDHLGSMTLKTERDQVELTWGSLDVFIQRYGSHRLMDHPKYLAWKKTHDAG